MTIENAVPIAYLANSMTRFGLKTPTPIDVALRESVLKQYDLYLNEADLISKRLSKILARRDTDATHLSSADVAYYRGLLQELSADLNAAHADADRCYRDAQQCMSPKVTLPHVTWPSKLASVENGDIGASSSLSSLASRITDRVRPSAREDSGLRQSSSECEDERLYQLSRGCINEREYFDLKAIGAAPSCVRSKVLISWQFCALWRCPLNKQKLGGER